MRNNTNNEQLRVIPLDPKNKTTNGLKPVSSRFVQQHHSSITCKKDYIPVMGPWLKFGFPLAFYIAQLLSWLQDI